MPQSRQVVRWAFGEDVNTVSDVFDCGDQFVVAVVTEVNEKGYTPVAKVSGQIKAELMKDKKAERMIADLQAKLAEGKSLEELVKALDVDVKEATGVSFASYSFGSAGFEPYVIGKAMTQEVNKLSQPIKGNSGVYVVLPTKATDGTGTFDAAAEIAQLNNRNMYSLSYTIYQDIRDNAEIVDTRSNFY